MIDDYRCTLHNLLDRNLSVGHTNNDAIEFTVETLRNGFVQIVRRIRVLTLELKNLALIGFAYTDHKVQPNAIGLVR